MGFLVDTVALRRVFLVYFGFAVAVYLFLIMAYNFTVAPGSSLSSLSKLLLIEGQRDETLTSDSIPDALS